MYRHSKKFLDKHCLFFEGKKKCIKCGEIKLLDDFTVDHARRFDGHFPRCNKCEREIHQNAYSENPERFKETAKKWAYKNPEKQKAWGQLHYAIQSGKVIKPSTCETCNRNVEVVAHHWNGYDPQHWLDIKWLCRKCHNTLSVH